MLSKINGFGIIGIEAFDVEIEVDIAQGLPATNIVGLADASVKESKERIKSAIKNSGFRFPLHRITVNLAPADTKKEGALFDLPIALGILASSKQIQKESLSNFVFLGELSLEGRLRPVKGALPIAMKMAQQGIKNIILPRANAKEAALIKQINVFAASSIKEVVAMLCGSTALNPLQNTITAPRNISQNNDCDFSDVKGQFIVKRALEIAVAGAHNILLIGPPGSGKSMLAKRIPSIMPDMSEQEIIETTCIHSSLGMVPKHYGIILKRPFRAPHHTTSDIALIGGGSLPHPGEISLAHNGVLFLDELPEFDRNVLETLRQPLEDGSVHISRAKKSLRFPSRFMLVGAMNPCPCGFFTDPRRNCRCGTTKIEKYLSRISGPLLDRIDIHIDVPSLQYKEISKIKTGEPSSEIRKRVEKARAIQEDRFKNTNIFFNSNMSHHQIKQFCSLNKESEELLQLAMEEMNFSVRAHDKILKIARTITDLNCKENIESCFLLEAIQYRTLDRQLWL